MSGSFREAWANVRARRGRVLLNAVGIVLVGAMLAVAATVSYGLLTGFDRSAAEADLPDVIVGFDSQPASTVQRPHRGPARPGGVLAARRDHRRSPARRSPVGRKRGGRDRRPGAAGIRDRRRPRPLRPRRVQPRPGARTGPRRRLGARGGGRGRGRRLAAAADRRPGARSRQRRLPARRAASLRLARCLSSGCRAHRPPAKSTLPRSGCATPPSSTRCWSRHG